MAGQIIKRGDSYTVRVYLGKEGGKRKYHNKTIHGTKKDAERYRNKALREIDTKTFTEPSKELLSDYLDTWAESTLKARVREKTYKDYKDRLRLYVKPVIGDLMLQQVGPEHVQKVYNKMLDENLSPRSVRYTHTILKNALQQAVKWGKIYRNPCDLVDLPRQKRKEMMVLSTSQAAIFMQVALTSPFKILYRLLLASGMRPGEALGLKWSNIDFEKKRLTVTRSLVRTKGSEYELQEPKTDRARRTIPLPETVIRDLLELKKEQDQATAERKAAEKWGLVIKEYKDQGFVFAAKDGEPLHDRTVFKEFKALLKDNDLPEIRLYDLRHTCATLLLTAGENPKVVSERLGHASITLTLDTYSHVLPDMQQAATEKLEGLLFNY